MNMGLLENKNPGSKTGDFLRPAIDKRSITSRLKIFDREKPNPSSNKVIL